MIKDRPGLGSATADWQPDNLMWTGVKLGFEQQSSIAAEWGGAVPGFDLAALAWATREARTPVVVVARYGPLSSDVGAEGLLSRHLERAMWNSMGLEAPVSPPLK